jgi:predicted  nucleic acid-binding Zn-ribbon protein
MTVTAQLLELFRVDKQLRGLRTRLDAAERFLGEQIKQQQAIQTRAAALEAQLKQYRAASANAEGEAKRLDQKIAAIREQMNAAKTAKEYNAFLTELGNYKDEKSTFEEQALAAMAKIEELEKALADLQVESEQRRKQVGVAEADRAAREAEIRDRLAELTAKRQELATGIPADALQVLEGLIRTRGDEAMAHVEVVDRRNYEYSCAACYMTLPMEILNSIVAGRLTRCVSCGSILYTEDKDIVRPSKQVAKT